MFQSRDIRTIDWIFHIRALYSVEMKAFLLIAMAMATAALIQSLTLATARAQEELDPIARLKSPDTRETFVYGDIKKRTLYWSEKKQEMSASITVSNAKYSGNSNDDESLDFRLPGVRFDKATNQFYVVMADTNKRIPFAEKKKAFMGSSILPARNIMIRVIKTGANVNVTVDVFAPEEVTAQVKAEEKAAKEKSGDSADGDPKGKDFKLQSLIDKK